MPLAKQTGEGFWPLYKSHDHATAHHFPGAPIIAMPDKLLFLQRNI